MKTSRAIFGIAAITMISTAASAQQSHHGTIVQVEEAKGTVTVVETPTGTTGSSAGSATQEYRLQDGLLFDALKVGDVVTFTVQEKDGVKTIIKSSGEVSNTDRGSDLVSHDQSAMVTV